MSIIVQRSEILEIGSQRIQPGGVGWGGRCDGGSREETYVCLLLIHAVYCRYQHNVENNYLPIKNRLKNNKIKSKKKSNLIGHLQALINTGQGI